ncbi:conserved hypothetical protein [Roseovarius sp. EC-HK134]|jgi:hypothetical protein|uniref:Uncharacterized protein n=1 Tax=Roseovarius mucosus TaxID=215743 RepID=A0A1V0RKQ0_9RHOB|nr:MULTISPECIES: hypothetical protein [Roseovarius]ARE82182.1 hypothetical protein ROSMUCSMR3_00681 [Roseovarius mucosus]AWZ22223.1 Hypothetical protein RAK1035_3516 [Roseovarius sp. AK1035]EDM30497.1 hypothetical protein RTM1035_10830 [Roseovarius sp. TM1035]MBW4972506.1 hypothetical protein [Roseovarius mucosus]VVT26146.1 conserved hypothetical protein [Roseovarius sp. EC-HK134]|tara:strand:- start:2018 stop:2248 length:231 start_codon:yes stop_codon:yes gene_type:complete
MEPRLLVALLLLPFAGIFAYTMWHEILRYRRDGRAAYGLGYCEETDSTHVTLLGDTETSYDPEETDSTGQGHLRDR